jgi:hypothetical protein
LLPDIEISGLPLKKAEIFKMMTIQQRLLKFITIANWVILSAAAMIAIFMSSPEFARGVIFGGLIVTVNFHLLYLTLKKAFRPKQLVSHNVVLAKYYIRFIASGIIILVLISKHYVNPIGLFIGLSVVVVSITLATLIELKNLFFKEAV